MMADLGADVMKVEPMRGDPMRGVIGQPVKPVGAAPLGAPFQMDNRGKRGIAVALDRPEGQELVRRLADGWPTAPTSSCATCSPVGSRSSGWTRTPSSAATPSSCTGR
ncbi:MAG: hypothetical protein NVS3B26_01920 [Mycobacteriales bacterium]